MSHLDLDGGGTVPRVEPPSEVGVEGVEWVSVGEHTCAVVCATGRVLTFGSKPDANRLGHPVHTDSRGKQLPMCPLPVSGLHSRATRAALGSDHGVVVSDDGKLFSWGSSAFGQLGHGSVTTASEPLRQVTALGRYTVTDVACGWSYTLCRTSAGAVFSWGAGGSGQLGHPDVIRLAVPTRVEALSGVHIAQIAAGESHAAAVDRFGVMYTWGCGDNGRLGLGSTASQSTPTPVSITDDKGATVRVASVACGSQHTGVVSDDGAVFTWGCGRAGRLGNGSASDVLKPMHLEVGDGVSVSQLACGTRHSVAVTDTGDLWAWGMVKLGSGLAGRQHWPKPTHLPVSAPDSRRLPARVVRAACGGGHILVQLANHSAAVWGLGDVINHPQLSGAWDEDVVGSGGGAAAAAAAAAAAPPTSSSSFSSDPLDAESVPSSSQLADGAAAALARSSFLQSSSALFSSLSSEMSTSTMTTTTTTTNMLGGTAASTASLSMAYEYDPQFHVYSQHQRQQQQQQQHQQQQHQSHQQSNPQYYSRQLHSAVASAGAEHLLPLPPSPADVTSGSEGRSTASPLDPPSHFRFPAGHPASSSAPAYNPGLPSGDLLDSGATPEPLPSVQYQPHPQPSSPARRNPTSPPSLESPIPVATISLGGLAPAPAPAPVPVPASSASASASPLPAATATPGDDATTAQSLGRHLIRVKVEHAVNCIVHLLAKSHTTRLGRAFRQWSLVTMAQGPVGSPYVPKYRPMLRHGEPSTGDAAPQVPGEEIDPEDDGVAGTHPPPPAPPQQPPVAISPSARLRGGGGGRVLVGGGRGNGDMAYPFPPSSSSASSQRPPAPPPHPFSAVAIMARVIRVAAVRVRRAALNHWRLATQREVMMERASEAGYAEAFAAYESRSEELRQKVLQSREQVKAAHQRMRNFRDDMTRRLLRQSLQYGRDKLIAVYNQHRISSTRLAFGKWVQSTADKRRSVGVKRARLKAQTAQLQAQAEQALCQQASAALAHERRAVTMHLMFSQWKLSKLLGRRSTTERQLRAERAYLLDQLRGLAQHLELVCQTQDAEARGASGRGQALLQQTEALNAKLASVLVLPASSDAATTAQTGGAAAKDGAMGQLSPREVVQYHNSRVGMGAMAVVAAAASDSAVANGHRATPSTTTTTTTMTTTTPIAPKVAPSPLTPRTGGSASTLSQLQPPMPLYTVGSAGGVTRRPTALMTNGGSSAAGSSAIATSTMTVVSAAPASTATTTTTTAAAAATSTSSPIPTPGRSEASMLAPSPAPPVPAGVDGLSFGSLGGLDASASEAWLMSANHDMSVNQTFGSQHRSPSAIPKIASPSPSSHHQLVTPSGLSFTTTMSDSMAASRGMDQDAAAIADAFGSLPSSATAGPMPSPPVNLQSLFRTHQLTRPPPSRLPASVTGPSSTAGPPPAAGGVAPASETQQLSSSRLLAALVATRANRQ